MTVGYLHKALKPSNQLRMMENALVIYRIARAPERRIFYIDVGNLPKLKAEQYIKDIMNKYRNKLVYDANTGEVRDEKKVMSMLEDFWLPRREGGKGTQIDTLPGGTNLGEIADIEYFQKLLYRSLYVPLSRLESAGGMNFGRGAEINRDEVKFSKFVSRLRKKFGTLLLDVLKTQLLLRNVIKENEWDRIVDSISIVFARDAFYTEQKEQDILRTRLELVALSSQMDGRYLSKKYIQKKILMLTDDELEEIEEDNAGNQDELKKFVPELNPAALEPPTEKSKK
jgi:hypothetical protein